MTATALAGQVFPGRLIGPDGTEYDKLRVLITAPESGAPAIWALADSPGRNRIVVVARIRYAAPLSGSNGRYEITDVDGGKWSVLKAAGCACSFGPVKRILMPFDPDDYPTDLDTVTIG